MEFIQSNRAPAAVGPYSQAVSAGGFLFLSGQIALDPGSGEIVGSDIESQSRQVLANIHAVLEAAGRQMSDVVKTTVYLVDLADFQKFNGIYQSAFGSHRPARATVQVSALPKGARLEMDAIVSTGHGSP